MTETPAIKPRSAPTLPRRRSTPLERGQALRYWMSVNGTSIDQFAADTGLPRTTLMNYLSGATDLARMNQRNAELLLTRMGVSDDWAWDYFGIPAIQRRTFRSLRNKPLDLQAQQSGSLVSLLLREPLTGDVVIPAGYAVLYDPARRDGLVLVRVGGRLFALQHLVDQRGQLEVLGRLLRVDFSPSRVEGAQ